ncbi:MAG: phage protein Gp36 family protein [Verrucomicrobiota bacterium]
MSWISITEDDIERRLTGGEFTAVREAALSDGQPDPLPEEIKSAVRRVRGSVAACDRNKVGPDGTIPDELEDAFLAILRYKLLTRLPDVGLISDDRRREYDDAIALLKDTARCDFAVEQPLNPEAENTTSIPSPAIHSGDRQFDRTSQDGA